MEKRRKEGVEIMKYDKEEHLPQQVETLFQLKAGGDIENFVKVLDSIKIIMKDRTDFIAGIETDFKTREEKRKDLLVDAKKAIINSLDEKNDIEIGLSQIEYVIAESKKSYEDILYSYMDDVLRSCTTYDSGHAESEEESA